MNATDKVQICQLALHDDLIIVKEPLHLPSLTLGLLSFLSWALLPPSWLAGVYDRAGSLLGEVA